jgi:hypothetical protein
VNAKYDALANDHRQITNQLLALIAEREELLGTVSPSTDPCSPGSPLASTRTSVVGRGGEGVVDKAQRAEGAEGEEDLSPPIPNGPTKTPPDANP